MLTRDTIDTLAAPRDLAALDMSADSLSVRAIALLGFQRTKQVSKPSRKAWLDGDPRPMEAEAKARRAEIFNGALLEAYREFIPLRDYLFAQDITPRHILDIGCGQAVPDLFLHRAYSPAFTLVDIEETPEQYHLFSASGSGYASLAEARALLVANGAAPDRVATINPRKTPHALTGQDPDMVTSFYSCGFHYPIDDYADLMVDTVADGGVVCLDLRKRYLRRGSDALTQLFEAGTRTDLFEDARSFRVVVRGA